LKSKLLHSIVAGVLAVLPMAAVSQVAPEKPPRDLSGPDYKYEAFVGWGYTSLNQVNQSRSGLQGVSGSIQRNIGDHFGVKLDGGHYAWSVTSSNPGNPKVDMFLLGPQVHAHLFEKWSAFLEGSMGGVHTGGVSIEPKMSLAGGFGMGVDWEHSERWAIRLSGDDIASSFTLVPFQSGDSPHMRWNALASIGVVYHF